MVFLISFPFIRPLDFMLGTEGEHFLILAPALFPRGMAAGFAKVCPINLSVWFGEPLTGFRHWESPGDGWDCSCRLIQVFRSELAQEVARRRDCVLGGLVGRYLVNKGPDVL